MLNFGSGLERDGSRLSAFNIGLGGAGLEGIAAANGAEFTNSPLSFTGFQNDIIVGQFGGGADNIIRFLGGSATVGERGLLEAVNASAVFVAAPNQPNWHEDTGDSPAENDAANWSISLTTIDFIQGVDATDFRDPSGGQATLGVFFRANVFQRDYTMFGVVSGTNGTKIAELTFDIVQWDDTSNVLARAIFRLEYIRGTG